MNVAAKLHMRGTALNIADFGSPPPRWLLQCLHNANTHSTYTIFNPTDTSPSVELHLLWLPLSFSVPL